MKSFAKHSRESGEVNPFLIAAIFLGVAAVALGVAFGWAYMQMNDYKDNTNQKINVAVEEARAAQKTEDAKNYVEEAKKPNLIYQGPSDFGSVTFNYPKTWAAYLDKDGTGQTSNTQYLAYFAPKTVPPVSVKTSVFALRMNIQTRAYDDVLKTYDNVIKKGEVSASPITVGKTADFKGYQGMRMDGTFDDGLKGSAVIFKIRDKTLTLRTDSQDYMSDFNNTVLPSLKFEQ